MNNENKTEHYHTWENLGLIAPYKLVCLVKLPSKSLAEANPSAYNQGLHEAWQVAKANGVEFGLGSCSVCGTGLQNNFICKDANGKGFITGCECVQKLGDSKLVTAVEKAELQRKRELRQAKAAAKREARQAAYEAELQAQRERNGGLTDYELNQKQQREAAEAKREELTDENEWLISVLEGVNGRFAADMVENLQVKKLADFSPRQIEIMKDIYAKSFGRRNSKAYNTAYDEFDEKLS